MRTAYSRFSGTRGFTPAEFRQVVNEVAGADFSDWLRKALETTEELDYREALDWYGLQFTSGPRRREPGQIEWQGLRLKNDNNRLIVTQVRRGTAAYASGINVDDEIIALDDFRVKPEQWDTRTATFRIGEGVSVLIARRDELMRFTLTLALPEVDEWQIRRLSTATPLQQQSLQQWLGERP